MTKDQLKRILRLGGWYTPDKELDLDSAIDDSIDYFWYCHQWSFRKRETTFAITANVATVAMPNDLDSVLNIVYDTNNRKLSPLPKERINEIYSNISRSDTYPAYFDLHDADADKVTLEIAPTPTSGFTATLDYLKKIEPGDLSSIPAKHHRIIRKLAIDILRTGEPSPLSLGLIDQAKVADKPIIDRKWNMQLDAKQAARVDERNRIAGVYTGDTTAPYY